MAGEKPRRVKWWRVALWAFAGLLIGGHVGMLAGGVNSVVFGQPFSGRTDGDVFLPGMVFPGLVVFAPPVMAVGAAIGVAVGLFRALRQRCRSLRPESLSPPGVSRS